MKLRRIAATLALATVGSAALMAVGGGVAMASDVCAGPDATVRPNWFDITHLDGTTQHVNQIANQVRAGDTITGTFIVNSACSSVVLSAASYYAPSATVSHANELAQRIYASTTGTFAGGSTATLTIKVPLYTEPDTSNCPNPHQTSPQAGNGNGSTSPDNPYASTCDGRASENGKGSGNATGKPCAGCVGNADNKNPPGQAPDGSDHNAGYECDRNQGVGKTNPAHTGCREITHFQVDFVVGGVLQRFVDDANGNLINYTGRKIPGGQSMG